MQSDILTVDLAVTASGTSRCHIQRSDADIPLVSFRYMAAPTLNIKPDDQATLQSVYLGVYGQISAMFQVSPQFARMSLETYVKAMATLMDLPTSYCSMCPYECPMYLQMAVTPKSLAA